MPGSVRPSLYSDKHTTPPPYNNVDYNDPPPYNEIRLTRDLLKIVLKDLSKRLLKSFGQRKVRLVVHGGVVMVLHPCLSCRKNTRDVDYIHRSFVMEWARLGVYDAEFRLRTCIAETAEEFGLGADWMNGDPDIALPMSQDAMGNYYDPIYADAITPFNLHTNTIFDSSGLQIIGVSWSWAIALKLVRYQKYDPYDIANILRLGYKEKGVFWTRQTMEGWLAHKCSAMGYVSYPPWLIEETRKKMRHAIQLAQARG